MPLKLEGFGEVGKPGELGKPGKLGKTGELGKPFPSRSKKIPTHVGILLSAIKRDICNQTTFWIFPALRHLAQTLTVVGVPLMTVLTAMIFGLNTLFVVTPMC